MHHTDAAWCFPDVGVHLAAKRLGPSGWRCARGALAMLLLRYRMYFGSHKIKNNVLLPALKLRWPPFEQDFIFVFVHLHVDEGKHQRNQTQNNQELSACSVFVDGTGELETSPTSSSVIPRNRRPVPNSRLQTRM